MEKRAPVKDPPYPLTLNKKEYFAYHEAAPHELLYCEFPYCTATFIPYLVWGSRHHCRACGISVCGNHSTQNITLSSHILTIYHGDLAGISTPLLATSMDEGTLPATLALKYACLLCTERALPRPAQPNRASKPSKPITGKLRNRCKSLVYGSHCRAFCFDFYLCIDEASEQNAGVLL